MRKLTVFAVTALVGCMQLSAQNIKLNGVYQYMRNDENDQPTEWVGSIYDENGNYTGKTLYFVPQGLYTMTWNGSSLTTPAKEPAVTKSAVMNAQGKIDLEKANWATNFNLMVGNSGAAYVDGKVVTVMSRDYQSTEDEELYAVRKWDAKTGELLSTDIFGVDANLESAGMSYNPKDGKVYGLFHFVNTPLNEAIVDDPDYYTDEDDHDSGREHLDDGWAIGTIDLATMAVTQITPGLYYGNYVAFAINSEGRAFALTSGGASGYIDDNGKIRDLNGNLSGATLCEFNLATGLMMTVPVVSMENVYDEAGNVIGQEEVTTWVSKYAGTGYASQVHRQSACFSKSNPNKLYWNGYYNSGKGINSWGSWGSLPDKEWKTNGKFDTCLYEIDIETGEGTRLSKIKDRYTFCALWADGDDCSDGSGYDMTNKETTGIVTVKTETAKTDNAVYNLNGQRVSNPEKGLFIANGYKYVVK